MPTQTITPPAERKIAQKGIQTIIPDASDFCIELPYSQAIEMIRMLGTHNDFEPERVIESLERIDRSIPRSYHGESSPYNGQRDYKIKVGRECSPVIYIERYEFYRHPEPEHMLTQADMKTICMDMEVCAYADEPYYRVRECGTSRKITFRFWWD